eukprot:scaffold42147_cov70-Phaeocystis_antarctica.AAC.1
MAASAVVVTAATLAALSHPRTLKATAGSRRMERQASTASASTATAALTARSWLRSRATAALVAMAALAVTVAAATLATTATAALRLSRPRTLKAMADSRRTERQTSTAVKAPVAPVWLHFPPRAR